MDEWLLKLMLSIALMTTHLDNEVLRLGIGHHVEEDDLWAESGGHLLVHLPACLRQLLAQLLVVGGQAVVGAQGKCTAHEAH
jgi:hypothetical protein